MEKILIFLEFFIVCLIYRLICAKLGADASEIAVLTIAVLVTGDYVGAKLKRRP